MNTQQAIEQLKSQYDSNSEYFPIWKKVKEHGKVSISILDGNAHFIRKGVSNCKRYDYQYRAACQLEYGHQLHLIFELDEKGETMLIKLKDNKDELNILNIM